MSFSEKSFGARVDNAQKLLNHLQNFKAYVPLDKSMEIASLDAVIKEAKNLGSAAVVAIQDYSAAVELRQQAYFKSPDALQKLVSPIAATVRSVYGKNAKEYQTVSALVVKIRGNKVTKPKKTADENTISQSQRSFGNMSQAMSDLMDILSGYNYKPANEKIGMGQLEDLHSILEETNQNVTTTFGKQKECRNNRQLQYEALNNLTQRIKDAIKSQYGPQSTEYKLVKGLKI
jgi:hypothetical protein